MINIKWDISGIAKGDPESIAQKILSEIKKKSEYNVLFTGNTSIKFWYNTWGIGTHKSFFGLIDSGKFDLSIHHEKTVVKFSYQTSLLTFFIPLLVIIFFALTHDPHLFYFLPPIFIACILKIVNVKSVAAQMMKNILNPE